MVNIVRVNPDNGRNFHPLADHTTKLRNFTKGENHHLTAFRFSLHLMLEQALSNLIVCLMISHKNTYKRASMLQWIPDRFGFSQN